MEAFNNRFFVFGHDVAVAILKGCCSSEHLDMSPNCLKIHFATENKEAQKCNGRIQEHLHCEQKYLAYFSGSLLDQVAKNKPMIEYWPPEDVYF